ncbi:hypothetical protein NVP1293O_16 [Vibrio phage 1.293.O._10N.261.52.E1]|nr:hypothetical protein NVP1293O_16 [Vibrio phage 1.293.O._10N.261.52.E1]
MSTWSTDFLGNMPEVGDFLESSPVTPPLRPEYAGELATAASLLTGADRNSVENNLSITGQDPSVDVAMADASKYVRQLKIEELMAHGAPQQIAAELPLLAQAGLKSESQMLAFAVTKMSDENSYVTELAAKEELGNRLDTLTSWIGNQREQNATLDEFEARMLKDSSWGDLAIDFGEALAPIYSPIAERSQRADLVDGGISEFVQRSGATDEIAEAILNAPQGQQQELLLKALDAIEASETAVGNKNSLMALEIVADLRNKINEGSASVGEWSLSNTLSEMVGAVDLLEIGTAADAVKWIVKRAFPTTGITKGRKNRGSLLDATNHEDQALAQRNLATDQDISRTINEQGNTVDDVIDRVTMQPEGMQDSLGLKGDFLDYDPTVLHSRFEQRDIAGNVARRKEKAIGNSAAARMELGETLATDVEGSMGKLRLRFGPDLEDSYSYDEAVSASNNFVGEKVSLVKRTDEGFVEAVEGDTDVFIQVDTEVFFDPKRDAGAGELAGKAETGLRDNSYLLNPWRRYDASIMKAYFGHKSMSRGVQLDFLEKMKPIQKLKGKDSATFNDLVRQGDAAEKVFTKEEAYKLTSGDLNDKSWDAYVSFRELQNELYQLENLSHRRALDADGFKTIDIDGETEFLRPSLKPRVSGGDGANDFKGKAYDIEKREVVDITEELLKEIQDSGAIIGKSRGTRAVGDEDFSQLIVRTRENIQPLPLQTLNKRKGHYARFYEETGYMVTKGVKRTINGIEVDKREVLGIFPDSKAANDFNKTLGEEAGDVVFSRESNQVLADVGGVTELGWQPINQRKRGQQLAGPDGNPAKTLDPLASATRQFVGIERKLGKDYSELMRSRWLKEYGQYMRGDARGSFPAEFSNDIFNPDALKTVENTFGDRDIFKEAKVWHEHIQISEGMRDAPALANFSRSIERQVNRALNKGNPIEAAAYKVVDKALSAADIRKLTTYMFIFGRPLFQIPTNLLQLSYLAIRSPVSGTMTVAQTVPFASALALRNTKGWGSVSKGLAKAFGMKQPEFEQMVDGFRKSGLFTPQMANDFIRQSSKVDGSVGMNPITAPFHASRQAQGASVIYANMGGYIQAYKETRKALGRAPVSAKERSEILADADLLLQSQNAVDEFAFQQRSNPLSFALQFMQHVTKLFYDMVLDPTIKLTTGKQIGKNPSKFATTRSQAATTLTGVATIFGVQGLAGQESGTGIAEALRMYAEEAGLELDDESWAWFTGGAINSMLNRFIDGDMNFTGRISPAGVVDSVVHQMLDEPASFEWLGASGAVLDIFSKSAKLVGAFSYTEDGALDYHKIGNVAAELARTVPGIDDAYKGYFAYHMGVFLTGTDKPIANATQEEAWLRTMSFRSWDEAYSNMDRTRKFSRQDKVKSIGDIMVRYVNNRLLAKKDLPLEDKLDYIHNDLMPMVYHSAEEGLGDDLVSYVRTRMVGEQDLEGDTKRQAFQYVSHEQALDNLKRLKLRGTGNEETLDWEIKTLQEIIDTDIKVE